MRKFSDIKQNKKRQKIENKKIKKMKDNSERAMNSKSLSNKSKEKIIKEKIESVNEIYNKDWIASIDTEYKILKDGKIHLYEIGYTLKNLKTKKLISKHFIVKDFFKQRNKNYKTFNKGFSEFKDLKDILPEVEKDMSKAQLIIGNSIDTDKKVLKVFGYSIPEDKTFELNHFAKFFSKNINSTFSLKNWLNLLKYNRFNLHNAGNDSYYSIRVFLELIRKYNNMNFTDIEERFKKRKIVKQQEVKEKTGYDDKELKRKRIILKNLYSDKKLLMGEDRNKKFTDLFNLDSVYSVLLKQITEEKFKETNSLGKENFEKKIINELNTKIRRFLKDGKMFIQNNEIFLNLQTTIKILKILRVTYKLEKEYEFKEFLKDSLNVSNESQKVSNEKLNDLSI